MDTKEREILMIMRKVLGSVIRDTTPPAGMRHPLSERTIQDVRQCLGLIAAREKELAEAAGAVPERPYFADEPQSSKVVPLTGISRGGKDGPDEER